MKPEPTVRFAIGWLAATLALAHLLAAPNYAIVSNTLSELGAQNAEFAWIARVGFIGFGVMLAWHYSGDLVHVQRFWAQAVLLLLYGSSIALTGMFSTAPIEGGVPFSEPESILHSMFATLAGICLSLAILVSVWRAPSPADRWRHALTLVFVIGMSILFALLPEYQGISQRLLWVGGLWWLGWGKA